MNKIIRNLENLLHEVHKTKGWKFVEEPLWVTWSLEKFGEFCSAVAIFPLRWLITGRLVRFGN